MFDVTVENRNDTLNRLRRSTSVPYLLGRVTCESILTSSKETLRLIFIQLLRQHRAVTVQYSLAPLQQRNLEVESLQDLDESFLKPGDFEPILDSADESYRINLCANILKQTPNERWKTAMG